MTKRDFVKMILMDDAPLDSQFIVLDVNDSPCEFVLREGALSDTLYMDILYNGV